MAVTGIRNITNLTNGPIDFKNEESQDNRTVQSNQQVDTGNAWTPWCEKADDFTNHHIEIKAPGKVLWYIWQCKGNDGDFVRKSTSGWQNPDIGNELIPVTGQSIALVLESDGNLRAVIAK
jgi:hypothetical protein